MMDLVTLMNRYRKNTRLIPISVWFRDGEESAQDDGSELGNIEGSVLPLFVKNKCIEEEIKNDPALEVPEEHEEYAAVCSEAYRKQKPDSSQNRRQETKNPEDYSLIFVKASNNVYFEDMFFHHPYSCLKQLHRKAVRKRAKDIIEKFR